MRIGVVGAGKIAQKHIASYQGLNIEDIYVFDSNPAAAKKIAKEHNAKCTNSLEEIINSVDVIDVCTPVKTHRNIILQSLSQKKHIFCEKPLCETVDEANEIKRAVEKSKTHLMTGYLYRFHPKFQQVKKWLDRGIIGDIHFGIFRVGGRGNHKKWKHLKETGGGCINEMLVHKLDLINFLFSRISDVKLLTCDIILKERIIDGEKFKATAEDNLSLSLKAGNCKLICQADFTTPCYMEYIELHGSKGSIFTSILDSLPTALYLNEPIDGYKMGNNFIPPEMTPNLFELELKHFIDSIKNQTENTSNINDSIKLLKITESIEKQAEKFNAEYC